MVEGEEVTVWVLSVGVVPHSGQQGVTDPMEAGVVVARLVQPGQPASAGRHVVRGDRELPAQSG